MLNWLPYPFLRFALIWVGGTIWAFNAEFSASLLRQFWLLVLGVFYLQLLFYAKSGLEKHPYFLGITALSVVMLSAMVRVSEVRTLRQPEDQLLKSLCYWGEVVNIVKETTRYRQIEASIIYYHHDSIKRPAHNKVIWYQPDDLKHDLRYGDRVLIRGAPQPVPAPPNPYQFDYRRFLIRQGIQWRHWLEAGSVMTVIPAKGYSLYRLIHGWKQSFRARLQQHLGSGPAFMIAGAILLGDRQEVSDQVEKAYADSGTIHVLAVSGLHLGILYGALLYLLGWWRHRPVLKWCFLLLALLLMWTFTLLTGMAPSTRRAAIMFSMLLAGKCWSRRGNSYNALALSACIILYLDPYELYSVGFQLSYLALGGILYLQPKIASLLGKPESLRKPSRRWLRDNPVTRYLWDIITVSLAAQVMVLPLTTYYFHQIPSYFLLGNIFMIPLTLVILITGALFLLFSFSPWCAQILGLGLKGLLDFAYRITTVISSLPGSVWDELWIDKIEMVLWYLTITAILLFVKLPGARSLLLIVALWGLFLVHTVLKQWQSSQRNWLVVYHVPGCRVMDFVNGNFYTTEACSGLSPQTVKYQINPLRNHLGMRPGLNSPVKSFSEHGDAWWYNQKLILQIKAPIKRKINTPAPIDVLIVSNHALSQLDSLESMDPGGVIVTGNSNNRKFVTRLQHQAQDKGYVFYNLREGDRIIDLGSR